MNTIRNLNKDPDEDLDYTWEFSAVLATGEEIDSFSFPDAPEDVPLHDTAGTTNAVTAWLGPGGNTGSSYDFTCRIVTDSTPPRTYDRTIRITMVKK